MADLKNPFQVLNLSVYDTKTAINERADELSFESPDDEEIIEQARNILLNPRKRIAAEVYAFAEKGIFTKGNILEDIALIDKNFFAQDADELREKINTARLKSKFPAVQDTADIKAELTNIRYEIREKIQDGLKDMTRDGRVKVAGDLAWTIGNGGDFGIIVEDFFECYRLEMNPFFETIRKELIALTTKIKFNANEKFIEDLDSKLAEFGDAIKPLNKISMAIGTNKFHETEDIFYGVRSTAIDLHNEQDLIDEPLRITRILEKHFYYLPTLQEKIRQDIKDLEELQKNHLSPNGVKAADVLTEILDTMDKRLHFENDGYEQSNMDFYKNEFKLRHEPALLRAMSLSGFKPDELKTLNTLVYFIYIKMGKALTWTTPSESAFNSIHEMFKKALFYAEASSDAESISNARKMFEDWKDVGKNISTQKDSTQQTPDNSSSSSNEGAGCFTVIVFAVIGTLIGGPIGGAIGVYIAAKISENK